jgi:hypothetical protein
LRFREDLAVGKALKSLEGDWKIHPKWAQNRLTKLKLESRDAHKKVDFHYQRASYSRFVVHELFRIG